jgi:LPXTG-motif cell wall-anchored protein
LIIKKIEQFSGTSQYYLVTPTGLELHQDSLNLTGKVMIHYLDETGQSLQTATELTGELGQSFTLPVPTFENYQLTEAPTELTGTFTRSLQEYTFIYERKAGGDITIQYKDEQGNQLADEEVLQGKLMEPYQATAKTITGYQLKSAPTEQQGVFDETAKTIVFIYEPVAAAPVTIKYQDETGTEIAPTETMTGKFNETYQVYPKNLADWVLKEQPTATTGIFTLTPQTLIFIYERAKGQTVYVQYLNEQQEMIAPTESLEGKVGETYQATAKDLSGWRLKQQPTNASGTFTNEIQYVTYLYEKIVTGDVKIYYQDNDDNHLLPMETVTGEVGTAFHIPTKDIPGYILKETVGTLVGNYTKETQAIFFKYERKTAAAITVNYIDIDSGEILETVSLSGKIGDPYSIELKEIPGYTLVLEAIKQRASFIQGIFGEQQPAEILITYRKNAVNDQPTTDTDDKDPSAESIDPEDRPQNGSKIEEESASTGAALDANKIKNATNDQAMKQKTESKPTLANNGPKSAEPESADLPKTNEKNYSWLSIITGLSVWLLLTASLLYLRRVYKV